LWFFLGCSYSFLDLKKKCLLKDFFVTHGEEVFEHVLTGGG